MAILKYAEGIDPLRKEHYGYTFVRSNYGRSVLRSQRNDRKRYSAQWQRMFNLIECTRNWRNLSAGVKAAWSAFATAFPQPTKRDPDKYLTGYQLFVKRNYYQFLHEGPSASFITEPELTILNDPEFSIMINADGQCIDITELYIARFGILPDAGQFVIVRIVPISQVGGAFFPPLIATVEVDQVYIDGLFVSFFFTSYYEEVEFSIYVSKPVWESVQFPGTKFRYMGCFKPTKFIQLTDTPDSYVGEAGKVVAVKGDETGVEFIDAGGGGIDCDDLAGCSLIQQMQDQIDAIGGVVAVGFDTSLPPVKYGALYNNYCLTSPLLIASSGWEVPLKADWQNLVTFLGGLSIASAHLKEPNSAWWGSIPAGTDNSSKMNLRGAGIRNGFNGAFEALRQSTYMGCISKSGSYVYDPLILGSSNAVAFNYARPLSEGHPVRLVRRSPIIAENESGFYVGNNGRVYRTIRLNGIEWMADDLAETLFRDGSLIPEVTVNSAWYPLTSPALCVYDNDWANV